MGACAALTQTFTFTRSFPMSAAAKCQYYLLNGLGEIIQMICFLLVSKDEPGDGDLRD